MAVEKRFDGEAFVAALDAVRQSRKLTWKKVASEARVPASTLTRMSQGRNPDIDTLTALCDWSGLQHSNFSLSELSRDTVQREPLAEITACLRADGNLGEEGMRALEAIIKTAYDQLRRKD